MSETLEVLLINLGRNIAGEDGGDVSSSGTDEVSREYASQQKFDDLVRKYNDDYLFLLARACMDQYDCLLTSFLVLKGCTTRL
jgi:hypothetical protein